jgi:uncharacterized membrane protein YbhN (UPF0104 family)
MTSAVLTAPSHTPATRSAGMGNNAHAHHWWWRIPLLAVLVGLAVLELRDHLPDPASTWAVVRRSAPGPLLAAAVLQVVSMAAFAEQQRHLLAAFGVRMSAATSLALTYTRSAMTTALPGGSAVSAGYALREYRARGASQPVAVAVMLLSGVASVTGLALVYVADLVAWITPARATLTVVAAVLPLAAVAARCIRPIRPERRATLPRSVGAPTSRLARLRCTVRGALTLAAHVPARRWLGVFGLAALNWLTDLACLLAAVQAVGLTVPTRDVATAYLAVQLIRQIPATPGGIGIIEASLIVALTTAGAAPVPAAGAVLVYRLLSCWGLLPIGALCWATRRSTRKASTSVKPSDYQRQDLALAHG